MSKDHIQNIRLLLEVSGFEKDAEIIPLPLSGSNRNYFRVLFSEESEKKTILAAYNNDISENIAWNSFSVHFQSHGLKVPEIYARDSSYCYFLLQDLGNTTLFNMLEYDKHKAVKFLYQAASDLLDFQIKGINNLDLDVAYPVKTFNRRSVMWDLNYFKYYFIKPHEIRFNEERLESDFETMADILLESKAEYFNYRDFQSRNIMVNNDVLWYIDFQGGRMGPLQYDLVSLLNQVKASISNETKTKVYNYYLAELEKRIPGIGEEFEKYYVDFEYFRLMQVMGAYGFRGKVQRKGHFLQSIAPSIKALQVLLESKPFRTNLQEIHSILKQITEIKEYKESTTTDGLVISVNSFSYKNKGIPIDTTGNGGGHVFDCRSLPNPFRDASIRDYCGLDNEIIDFFKDKAEMTEFLSSAKAIIDQSVSNYISRDFKNLQISFGCTGGKHRSVYSASKIGKYLQDKYPEATVIISHNELR